MQPTSTQAGGAIRLTILCPILPASAHGHNRPHAGPGPPHHQTPRGWFTCLRLGPGGGTCRGLERQPFFGQGVDKEGAGHGVVSWARRSVP
ncbi:hypothetical protein C8F01DRAFT_683967 [Mycena amicta]|nr:hypothetical protein C8F01DRAFT_683967 [Mycena amicta]